jgi:hypothetical protein
LAEMDRERREQRSHLGMTERSYPVEWLALKISRQSLEWTPDGPAFLSTSSTLGDLLEGPNQRQSFFLPSPTTPSWG